MTTGLNLDSVESSSMELAGAKIAEEARAWSAIARQPASQLDCGKMAGLAFPELLYYVLVFDGSR